ncbi:hypothetical protein [Ruegeria sp. MALMAid1280]|uniref:hypothetical protein n=1 Tax=Ruegeria sp. MALMAid1280 TaxID=3411634 RepID=UPI003BA00055
MKKILLSTMTVLALAACEDPFDREGVGFTGIDGEPRSISDVPGAAAFLPPATNVPAELAVLPTISVTSDETEIEEMARVAINNAGQNNTNAVHLTASGANLYLSNVNVNGTLFGVLRTSSGKVSNSYGSGFGQGVEQLTGCLSAGNVYRKGNSKRSSGFAVPLNCS